MGQTQSATVRLGESTNFVEIPNVGELLEGEAVSAAAEDGTHLVFFDDSKVYLDRDTQVTLTRIREREQDDSVDIELFLDTGRVWASIPQKINPRSKVLLKTGGFTLETQGGEFSLSTEAVQVASGRANVFVGNSFYETLEVGQGITFSEDDFAAIAAGVQGPKKTIITADFQESDWFTKNMSARNELAVISLPDEALDDENEDADEKSTDDSETKGDEERDSSEVKILEPGTNETVVEIGASEIAIKGSVPKGTQKVVVNGYTLTKFAPGNTTFAYNAAVRWGTVKKGANEYTVVAFDKEGNRKEAGITIVYDPDKAGNQSDMAESPKPTATLATASASSGETTISSPANGVTVNDEVITISGKAPQNATRIVVDGYTLSQYTAGSGSWIYRMSDSFGNRPTGEATIGVKTYDAAGKLLGSDEVTFTIEKALAKATPAATTSTASTVPVPSAEVAPPSIVPTDASSI